MNKIQRTKRIKVISAFMLLALLLIIVAPIAAGAADNPLSLKVEQVFTTSSATAEATFTYRLKALAEGNPLPAQSTAQGYTFTISGSGSAQVGPLNFEHSGVYAYEIFQVIGEKKADYTYDERVYKIEVYVDPELNAICVVLNEDETKAEDIRFANWYQVEPDEPAPEPLLPSDPNLMVDPPVRKSVFGNPSVSSIFKFKLTARDASYPMPQGSENGTKIIQILGAGAGEFGTWSYKKAGVYYYMVSEIVSGEKGYTYDTAVYTITDTVQEENGQLMVSRIVTNELNKQVTSLTFINYYSAGGGPSDKPDRGDSGSGKTSGGGSGGSTVNVDNVVSEEPLSDIDGDATPLANWLNNLPLYGLPKTGDGSNTTLFLALLAIGGALTIGAITYLTVSKKRGKGRLA